MALRQDGACLPAFHPPQHPPQAPYRLLYAPNPYEGTQGDVFFRGSVRERRLSCFVFSVAVMDAPTSVEAAFLRCRTLGLTQPAPAGLQAASLNS